MCIPLQVGSVGLVMDLNSVDFEIFEVFFGNIASLFSYHINIWQIFNVDINDLAMKPYIPLNSCFWPLRLWKLLEAKNTNLTTPHGAQLLVHPTFLVFLPKVVINKK